MWRVCFLVSFVLAFGTARAQNTGSYAQAGALATNGVWEVGVAFDGSVAPGSITAIGNYTISDPGARIDGIRYEPLDNAAVLSVAGLQTNSIYSLNLTNFQTLTGTALPAASVPFKTSLFQWTAIGSQELGFTADAVAIGTNGFDLISGGIQMRDVYDESTFVYETITGDFDRRVRITNQEPSSASAKAGLMVREALDTGRTRPSDPFDPAQAFSRYLQISVSPLTSAVPDNSGATNGQYEISIRSYTGGIGDPNFDVTVNPPITNNAAAAYPNAWLRLKRAGQTFYVFRGDDGTNWTQLGTFSFPSEDAEGNTVPPFSSTAFVGPNYTPETGNIPESSGARRAFLAQFRDYSEASGDVIIENPVLSISYASGQVEIGFTGSGTLQTAMSIAGPWTNLGTTFPARVSADKPSQFFRVKVR